MIIFGTIYILQILIKIIRDNFWRIYNVFYKIIGFIVCSVRIFSSLFFYPYKQHKSALTKGLAQKTQFIAVSVWIGIEVLNKCLKGEKAFNKLRASKTTSSLKMSGNIFCG